MRDIDANTQAASEADVLHPVYFVKLAFDSGDINLHSELGTITWGGDDYTGVGTIGGISAINEQAEVQRSPVSMSLSGIPNDIISLFQNESYRNRYATIYQGYLNLTTNVLVADPIIIFRGFMDVPDVQQGETNFDVNLSVENRFSRWDRSKTRRYNNSDQQAKYPGDRGLEFVEQTTEKQIAWGTALKI